MPKTVNQDNSFSKVRPLEAVLHLMGFALVTYISLPFISTIPGTPNGLVVTILCILFYLFVLVALAISLMGRGTKLVVTCLRIFTLLALVAFVGLGLALNQENTHTLCKNNAGIITDCVTAWTQSTAALVSSPFGIVVLIGILLSFAVALSQLVVRRWHISKLSPFKSISDKNGRRLLIFILSGGALILIAGLLLLPGAIVRGKAADQARAIVEKFKLQGQLIYSDAYELCSKTDVVINGKKLNCVQTAIRIYKGEGDMISNLDNLRKQLENRGYAVDTPPQSLGSSGMIGVSTGSKRKYTGTIHYGVFGASNSVLGHDDGAFEVGRTKLYGQSGYFYGISAQSERYEQQFP